MTVALGATQSLYIIDKNVTDTLKVTYVEETGEHRSRDRHTSEGWDLNVLVTSSTLVGHAGSKELLTHHAQLGGKPNRHVF